jgi:hypothetical protein
MDAVDLRRRRISRRDDQGEQNRESTAMGTRRRKTGWTPGPSLPNSGDAIIGRFSGGRADGTCAQVPYWSAVYITMVSGSPERPPESPSDEGFDLLNRAQGQWDCYVRDTDEPLDVTPREDGLLTYAFEFSRAIGGPTTDP